MRISSTLIIILLGVCSISYADKKTVAVLDLDPEGVSNPEAAYLTRRIRHELVQTGTYIVLERSTMEEILTEQAFQMSGCTSSECAVEAGQLLGVEKMIAGSVGKIGSMYTIFLRLIDVETGEIEISATADSYGGVEEVAAQTTREAVARLLGLSVPSSLYGQKKDPPLPDMSFVTIPSGSFMMGSDKGSRDEKPVHMVNIRSFQMMTTEVTQAQWELVMENNPVKLQKGDNLPVVQVSWNDVQEFIKKLNQRDPDNGYRLPSEAEWEYACRAGTTTKFHSGENESDLERVAWYKDNSESDFHFGGQKEPNAWGLYDMHGNVYEWCEDNYYKNYKDAPTDGSARLSPKEVFRVYRGGCYFYKAKNCRSANRFKEFPSTRKNDFLGFRLVRDADAR